jgi:hypothetical protein
MSKLIMTLLVRDEEDILRYNLEHHLRQGIDHFIITDNGSVDGTKAIIDEYVERGVATYFWEPELTYKQGEWVTRMNDVALDADFIINADADEFWVSETYNLKDELTKRQDVRVLSVPEYVIGLNYEDGNGRFPDDTNYIIPTPQQWGDRLMYRATRQHVVIGQGNHAIFDDDGNVLPSVQSDWIRVYHIPMRSYEQFVQKVVNGGSAYEASAFGPYTGDHWRRWYRLYKEGKLEQEFIELCVHEADKKNLTPFNIGLILK